MATGGPPTLPPHLQQPQGPSAGGYPDDSRQPQSYLYQQRQSQTMQYSQWNNPSNPYPPPGISYNSFQNVPPPPQRPPANLPGGWQQQPQVPIGADLNALPPPYGYLQQPYAPLPQPAPQQPQITATAVSQSGPHFSQDYHLVATAKRTMALLSPDHSQTLLTVYYPRSGGESSLTVKRGDSDGPKIGSATTHSFTTSKVDVEVNGKKLRFKKKFESVTGQGQLTWGLDSGSLLLEDGKGLLARFVPKDGDIKGINRLEGRLEIRRQGLNAEQFEEVVITGLAELERRRNDAEADKDLVGILTFGGGE